MFSVTNEILKVGTVFIFQSAFGVNLSSQGSTPEELGPFVFDTEWVELVVNGILGNGGQILNNFRLLESIVHLLPILKNFIINLGRILG